MFIQAGPVTYGPYSPKFAAKVRKSFRTYDSLTTINTRVLREYGHIRNYSLPLHTACRMQAKGCWVIDNCQLANENYSS